MDRHQHERDGFGKIGEEGKYGGIVTAVNDLPVGTKFRVENGAWDGEIIEVDGAKHLLLGSGGTIDLSSDDYMLDITIKREGKGLYEK